jgi:hypothetical protein
VLFVVPLLGHAASGTRQYNAEQRLHGQAPVSMRQYLGTAHFWFESFQNWQSEFLAVGSVIVLSLWLRERGSPESKPVHRGAPPRPMAWSLLSCLATPGAREPSTSHGGGRCVPRAGAQKVCAEICYTWTQAMEHLAA